MKRIILMLIIMLMMFITSCGLEHIEDTNGADDYSLCVLTKEDIIKGTSTIIGASIHSNNGSFHKEKVKKLSGVTNILKVDDSKSRTVYIKFNINSGNGIVAIVSNGNITHFFETNTDAYVTLKGGQEYIVKVAGESCGYELEIDIK